VPGNIQGVFDRKSQVALTEGKLLNVTIALINWLHDLYLNQKK
jgi:hypothetical protein